ncbi:3-oxoacyl-[acyl-carrier protein] reductase [Modicisalibacter xianhensis]|uniref:3-oxoacyl-[acyl-carrier protein] reductase n=1 Tax=Modicisalibacter xianhensis TaxID=442341 RepID=A0A4R8FVG4_9GAMM|nr:SDR family oxidoreductase [Halomonas xianhensis]TDX29527.1 3-oxoacyl-[acyl-carrier protein] reductase [Halomonas xianhensis]
MDLGIAGRWAVIGAASRGLGKGCASALAKEGVNLVLNARGVEALEATADQLRAENPRIVVHTVAGDIGTPEVRADILAACPQVDILVNNNGGPPPGDFRDWTRDDWVSAVDANMITPIELIKATVDDMASRGYGRVINITSGAVKAPIDVLGLSNGARSGLTGFIAGLARQPRLAGNNVTINNLLPGPFDTERLHKTLEGAAQASGKDIEEIRDQRRQGIPAQRFGSAEEFGAFCAFLCSRHAGYMTGQNILLDGGSYPGTF